MYKFCSFLPAFHLLLHSKKRKGGLVTVPLFANAFIGCTLFVVVVRLGKVLSSQKTGDRLLHPDP